MRLKTITLALTLAACPPLLADELLTQAEALIAGQKAAEAVTLLAPVEDERAGDPAFDYLIGLARLESGDPSQAIFALERCLGVEPNNGPCRVQIARAHLAVGETANARVELETIKASSPPPQVQSMVSQYLGSVSTLEKRRKEQFNSYVQLGLGHDSNTNSATSLSQVALPGFNNILFDVNPVSRSQDSLLFQGQYAASYFNRLSPTLTVLGEGSLQLRSYPDSSDYGYVSLDAGGGAAVDRGNHQFLGKLQLQTLQLGGDPFRNLTGLLGQYQYNLGGANRLAAWAQLGMLRYHQSLRDANRTTLGAAYSGALDGHYSPVFYASLYGGSEQARDSVADAASNDFLGLRAGGALTLTPALKLNGSISHEQREYQANFPNFGKARDDGELSLNLGLAWQFAPAMSLLPNYTFTRNDSNIPLTDYERHVFSLDIRFDL